VRKSDSYQQNQPASIPAKQDQYDKKQGHQLISCL
jgi:hypothetical protein